MTDIGKKAFYNCNKLTSIYLGASVKSIGSKAFDYDNSGGSSLSNVYIKDLAAWCQISFDNNTANPLYFASNLFFNNELVTEITIPNSVSEIKAYAFIGWDGTSIIIPGRETCSWGIEKPKQNILLNTSAMTASSF